MLTCQPCSQPLPCLLVGNGPRAYREALATALQACRPRAEVVLVHPDAVDVAVVTLRPAFVVCSTLTEVIETRVPAWILLYPNGARKIISSVAGERIQTADLDLDALLTLTDQAERLRPV